jgi:hypothetical protein
MEKINDLGFPEIDTDSGFIFDDLTDHLPLVASSNRTPINYIRIPELPVSLNQHNKPTIKARESKRSFSAVFPRLSPSSKTVRTQ